MSNPGPNITSTALLDQAGAEFVSSAVSSGDGKQIGKSSTSLVGFWGATPIAQPSSAAGNTTTPTAGAGAAVKVDTTFSGGTGSTAYTIGDIVKNLKTAGLLAS